MSHTILPLSDSLAVSGDSIESKGAALIARVKAAYQQHRRYRRIIAELDACSDAVLHDLGILRCDIPRIARQAVQDPNPQAKR